MALGYAKWFEKAYARCRASADECDGCKQGYCQPADHYEGWWDELQRHTVRRAEHPEWPMLAQFADGTVYLHAEGIDDLRALTDPEELAEANAVLDADWHNIGIGRPEYQPKQVRTKRKKRRI